MSTCDSVAKQRRRTCLRQHSWQATAVLLAIVLVPATALFEELAGGHRHLHAERDPLPFALARDSSGTPAAASDSQHVHHHGRAPRKGRQHVQQVQQAARAKAAASAYSDVTVVQDLIPPLSSLNVVDTGLAEVYPHPVLQAIAQYSRAHRELSSTSVDAAKIEPKQTGGLSENVMFVTWIAFGAAGDAGFKTHNFHKVDMRWAEVAKKSHPGCKIGLVLDQDTLLENNGSVDVLHRLTIDKSKFGRNEYNDLYHWQARYSMLEKLAADKADLYNVVFMDPDIFVIGDLSEIFTYAFDYAATISEGEAQPINGAMHFVRAGNYAPAIQILKDVLKGYHLDASVGFTSGQRAYSDFFELSDNKALVEQMNEDALTRGTHCRRARGQYDACFFTCLKYNFWEDCAAAPGVQVTSDSAADYTRVDVKVLHFIAYRKLGMGEVYEAFMKSGQEGAHKAYAQLPHTEAGFQDSSRFAAVA